jgi:pimeloyl-ACP methyl ester carboxylesterase
MVAVDYGLFEDRLPYYRFGSGTDPLVVVPGLSDAMRRGEPNRAVGEALARRYRAYTDDYTVWVVSRPSGLPAGSSTRDLAGGYATVLEAVGGGDVLGLSLGGFVAQHLAADYPALVDRLVLGVSASRLGEEGRTVVSRWRQLAAEGQWGELAADTARHTYVGWRRPAYAAALRAFGATALGRPATPADVVISCEACLDHDAGDRLAELPVPTLVVGGDRDELFPANLLRETAETLPEGRLELLPGVGHGATEQAHEAFDAAVLSFLGATAADPAVASTTA